RRHPSLRVSPYTTLFRSSARDPGRLRPGSALQDWRGRLPSWLQRELQPVWPGGFRIQTNIGDSRKAGFHLSDVALQQLRLDPCRSEEHTSELQSRENLVCRLLLE